jgi:hypothetical protein
MKKMSAVLRLVAVRGLIELKQIVAARSATGALKKSRLAGAPYCLKLMLAGWICLCCTLTGRAFSLFDYQIPVNFPFSDPLTDPNDHLHWNQTTITYSFDPSFTALFPASDLPGIEAQIELALNTWANASTIGYGPTYGYCYFDSLESSAFGDIRSITLHELGHALGLAHPGPPSVGSAGAYYDLNFIEVPGGGQASTLTQVNTSQADSLPTDPPSTEVMDAYFSSGEYRRILTWDELDAYAYIYGSTVLTFQKVSSGGNIVFNTWNGPVGNFAVTTPAGNQGSKANGSVITSATISYNVTPPIKVGYQTHGINWTCANNQFKVHKVTVRTHGTDNVTPVGYWDNNGTSYVFNSGGPPTGVSGAGIGLKNDISWTWTLPGATSATDIPVNTMFHPGLALDVNNWTVADSQCYDITGSFSSTIPLTAMDYMDNGLIGYLARPVSGTSWDDGKLTYYNPGSNGSCAFGFSIIASDAPQTVLSKLQFADVTGMGLSLSNLNPTGLQQLQTNGLVTMVTNFGVYTLNANTRFVVLLQGSEDCVPSDVATNGHYILLNRPDLLTRELFLSWQSTNSENTVANFALLSEPPVGSRPALTINAQRAFGTNSVQLAWDYPSIGFVLQQNSNLKTTNWVNVTNAPTVALSESLGVYQNQVFISSQPTQMFYRLVNP